MKHSNWRRPEAEQRRESSGGRRADRSEVLEWKAFWKVETSRNESTSLDFHSFSVWRFSVGSSENILRCCKGSNQSDISSGAEHQGGFSFAKVTDWPQARCLRFSTKSSKVWKDVKRSEKVWKRLFFLPLKIFKVTLSPHQPHRAVALDFNWWWVLREKKAKHSKPFYRQGSCVQLDLAWQLDFKGKKKSVNKHPALAFWGLPRNWNEKHWETS